MIIDVQEENIYNSPKITFAFTLFKLLSINLVPLTSYLNI